MEYKNNKADKRQLYAFAFFFVIFETFVYLSNDMLMPAMSRIVDQFGAEGKYIPYAMITYMGGAMLAVLSVSPFKARFGSRKVLLTGCFIFFVSSLSLSFSSNMTGFLILRSFQGLSLGFISIGYVLINRCFEDKDAIKLVSLMSSISILAILVGPIAGSLIISVRSWKYIFYITTLFALISLVGIKRTIPNLSYNKEALSFRNTAKNFHIIIKKKNLILYAFTAAAAMQGVLLWVAMAPTLLLHKLKLSLIDYNLYQGLAILGFCLGAYYIQVAIHRIRIILLDYIALGSILINIALLIIALASKSMLMISLAYFFMGLTCSLANATVYRAINRGKDYDPQYAMSMTLLIQDFIFIISTSIITTIEEYTDYSIAVFIVASLLGSIVILGLIIALIKHFKKENWTLTVKNKIKNQ